MRPFPVSRRGFTLVELAIVIVLIGLISGGILAGSSLIASAQLSKTTRQLQELETSTSAFRLKYNYLPGDLPNPANYFGPAYVNASPAPGHGNGNGYVEGLSSATTLSPTLSSAGEVAVFFHQLFDAGYLSTPLTYADLDPGSYTLPAATINAGMFLPTPIGKGSMFAPFSNAGGNFLLIVGPATGPAVNGAVPASPGVTPLQALYIDGKRDDGKPGTGATLSTSGTAPSATLGGGAPTASAVAGQDCYSTDTGEYLTGFDAPSCNLSTRAAF